MTFDPAQFAGRSSYEEALQAYANALDAPAPFSEWIVFANAIGKDYEDSPPTWPKGGSRGYYADLRNQTYQAAFGPDWKDRVVAGGGRSGTVPGPPTTAGVSGSQPGGAQAPAEMLRKLLMLPPREGMAPAVIHYRLLILLCRVGPAPAAMRGRLLGDPVREGARVLRLWKVACRRTYHSPCQWAELLS